MKRIIYLLLLFNLPLFCVAQGVLPVHRYVVKKGPLDELPELETSFGFSLRKISSGYTGPAMRVRRSSDNALADIDFDTANQNMITLNSNVTLVSNGTTTTLSTFKGTDDLFVEIWYNQSGLTGFDAVQNTQNNQPELLLNSAGNANDKPSVYFDGTSWLEINQPIENILDNGIRGSFILWTKPEKNKAQFSFGARFPDDWRWSFHINWTNGRVYFDAAERCCATNRYYVNNTNLNQYNSYTFIRGSSYKTARVNQTPTVLNNSNAPSLAKTGGEFWLGWNWGQNTGRYEGNLSEVFMFKTDISQAEAEIVETNQIEFWE